MNPIALARLLGRTSDLAAALARRVAPLSRDGRPMASGARG